MHGEAGVLESPPDAEARKRLGLGDEQRPCGVRRSQVGRTVPQSHRGVVPYYDRQGKIGRSGGIGLSELVVTVALAEAARATAPAADGSGAAEGAGRRPSRPACRR